MEATQFTWPMLEYMMSRLRSESKHPSRLVMSCNPDPDHQLRAILEDYYLDEEGYPIPERDGVVRYFIMRDGDMVWGETREELGKKYKIPKDKWEATILSFTFISATIRDNPPMLKNNPEYLAFLEGLNPIDKAQLLDGNWFARAEGSSYFKREWLHKVDTIPLHGTAARGWDKAASEPSQVEKNPDFTASVKLIRDSDGRFTIVGDYIEENYEKDINNYGRFRKRAGDRDNIIAKQGHFDGQDCHIVLPLDPAAAGKVEYQQSARKLMEEGLLVRKDPVAVNKSKLTRFTPFAVACENGLVSIHEGSFKNKTTLEAFYKELEAFDGEKSTAHRKDDWPDATASTFNYLVQNKSIPRFSLGNTSHSSKLKESKGKLIPDF